MIPIDISGQRFGRWVVIERGERKSYWLCRCDCGTIKEVYGGSLKNGHSPSCGCKKRKHGYEGTKVYRLWSYMKERCFSPQHKSYDTYGGRGITVCDEWLDPKTFIEWALANGYEEGTELTLDRIDPNGNYEPNNCRFATVLEQQNNRRNNHIVTIKGETKTIAEWAREYNMGPKTLRHRIMVGWAEEDLLNPVKEYRKKK